jgi:hypothetical protein
MNKLTYRMYWILVSVSQLALIALVLIEVPPVESDFSLMLFLFGIVCSIFTWIPISTINNIMVKNDEIDEAWKKVRKKSEYWDLYTKALKNMAAKKLGMTLEEIEKEADKLKER